MALRDDKLFQHIQRLAGIEQELPGNEIGEDTPEVCPTCARPNGFPANKWAGELSPATKKFHARWWFEMEETLVKLDKLISEYELNAKQKGFSGLSVGADLNFMGALRGPLKKWLGWVQDTTGWAKKLAK